MIKELVRSAPEALVYIEVPDAASYISPNKIRWHELYFEHLNHFCKDSLSRLAAKSCIEVRTEEALSFSQNLADIQCLSLVGQFKCVPDQTAEHPGTVTVQEFTLPPPPIGDFPPDNRPIALWGVSQYAMLLMGSLPQLKRVDRLFDASPAKIGRKIRGVPVEDAREIRTLSEKTILVVPFSQYSQEMRRELDESALFSGEIVNIQGSQEWQMRRT
jgi:hypothetical protein